MKTKIDKNILAELALAEIAKRHAEQQEAVRSFWAANAKRR